MKLSLNHKVILSLSIFCFWLNTCLGQSSLLLSDIEINFINHGSETVFNLTSNLGDSIDNSWIAIGFNGKSQMVCSMFFILIFMYQYR